MAHLHTSDKEWSDAKLSIKIEDLFECKKCKIEFALKSSKVKGKKVFCPLCKTELKAWQKEWTSWQYLSSLIWKETQMKRPKKCEYYYCDDCAPKKENRGCHGDCLECFLYDMYHYENYLEENDLPKDTEFDTTDPPPNSGTMIRGRIYGGEIKEHKKEVSKLPFKETWKDKFEIKCKHCSSTDVRISVRHKYTVFNYKINFYCKSCKKRGTMWRSSTLTWKGELW